MPSIYGRLFEKVEVWLVISCQTEGSSPGFSIGFAPGGGYIYITALLLTYLKLLPHRKPDRISLHQHPCPVVLEFKHQGVGIKNKVISSSLYEETSLHIFLKDKLVQEDVLDILAVAEQVHGYHGGVVFLLGG